MKALQAKAEKDRRGRSCYFQKGKAKAGRKCFRFPLLLNDSSWSADDKADRPLTFLQAEIFFAAKMPYAPQCIFIQNICIKIRLCVAFYFFGISLSSSGRL
jgi:hypothetical protein